MARTPVRICLDPFQKKALEQLARRRGTRVAHEIRRAVDVYLTGMTPEELELLDMLGRQAERELKEMAHRLDEAKRRLDAVFAEMGASAAGSRRREYAGGDPRWTLGSGGGPRGAG